MAVFNLAFFPRPPSNFYMYVPILSVMGSLSYGIKVCDFTVNYKSPTCVQYLRCFRTCASPAFRDQSCLQRHLRLSHLARLSFRLLVPTPESLHCVASKTKSAQISSDHHAQPQPSVNYCHVFFVKVHNLFFFTVTSIIMYYMYIQYLIHSL